MGRKSRNPTPNPPITTQYHNLLSKQATLETAKSIAIVDGMDLSPHPNAGPISLQLRQAINAIHRAV